MTQKQLETKLKTDLRPKSWPLTVLQIFQTTMDRQRDLPWKILRFSLLPKIVNRKTQSQYATKRYCRYTAPITKPSNPIQPLLPTKRLPLDVTFNKNASPQRAGLIYVLKFKKKICTYKTCLVNSIIIIPKVGLLIEVPQFYSSCS